MYDINVTV